MRDVRPHQAMGLDGRREILAGLRPADHQDVGLVEAEPLAYGLDRVGGRGREGRVDGLADEVDPLPGDARLLEFAGDGVAEGEYDLGAPGSGDDQPGVGPHRSRVPLRMAHHREVVDGDDPVPGIDGCGVGERENAAPVGEGGQDDLLESVVTGASRRRPDVAVDPRVADSAGRDHLGVEPGGTSGVKQGSPDAVQTGGPGAKEAPVDDEHPDIVTAPSTIKRVSSVSIVIPVRNGALTLRACLDALSRQQPIPGVATEVIVVDNGSSDATAAIAARHPMVSRVISERRPGSYAARNAGLAVAAGDLIAFTDADCIPAADWIRGGVEATIEGGAELVAGHVRPRVGPAPSVWERFDAGHHVDQRKYVETLGFGATANLFVRRTVFDAVGGFDGEMGSGGDRELCRRAVAAGFRLAYAPGAEVAHGSRRTARETWKLHRRLGAGLHQLHQRGLQPPWWRDDQMLLPLGWAAQVASDDTRRYRHRELLPLAMVVVAARAVGRVTGR